MKLSNKKYISISEASKINISWNEHSIGIQGFDGDDGYDFSIDVRNYDVDFRRGHRYEIKSLMEYLANDDREYFEKSVEEILKEADKI